MKKLISFLLILALAALVTVSPVLAAENSAPQGLPNGTVILIVVIAVVVLILAFSCIKIVP
ncbi:MAG: hypothetical protein II797_02820, partial [Clostridia bacterium]|nr:hypothetical protein [Clostridia bacterium]